MVEATWARPPPEVVAIRTGYDGHFAFEAPLFFFQSLLHLKFNFWNDDSRPCRALGYALNFGNVLKGTRVCGSYRELLALWEDRDVFTLCTHGDAVWSAGTRSSDVSCWQGKATVVLLT